MSQNIINAVNEIDQRHRSILIDQIIESLKTLPDDEFYRIAKLFEEEYNRQYKNRSQKIHSK